MIVVNSYGLYIIYSLQFLNNSKAFNFEKKNEFSVYLPIFIYEGYLPIVDDGKLKKYHSKSYFTTVCKRTIKRITQ